MMEVVETKTEFEKFPSYKDSKVDWLGDIPSKWELRRLKFLCKIKTGERNTEDKNDDGIFPFFVRSQKPERINTYSFDGEAILTAGDGAGVGKVYHYINGKFDYHQRVYKFSDFTEVLGVFLFYYIQSNFYNVATLGIAKSTVDSLRLPLIQDFEVCFPIEKSEQLAIANFLDNKTAKIDTAIAQKEKMIALLQERRQIIIQWAVTKGLDPEVEMKDSGVRWLGEIPKHWEVVRSKRLFSARKEKSKKDDIQLTASQKYGMIPQEEFMEREGRRVTQVEFNREILKHVERGDFVISMRSFQGGIEYSDYTGCISSAYIPLVPIKHVQVEYFKYLLKSDAYIQELRSTSNLVRDGQALRYENFCQVDLLIVPEEEQIEIAKYLDNQLAKMDDIISLQQQQIEKLKEYKSILINDVVTGKIKVS